MDKPSCRSIDNNTSIFDTPKQCQSPSQKSVWYPLRVTYNRSLSVRNELDRRKIHNFLPLKSKIVIRRDHRIRVLVPAIPNLIFVHSTPEALAELKATTTLPIRYIMDRETHRPIIVPDRQMNNFMIVAGAAPDSDTLYIDPEFERIQKGARVRVTAGLFAGAEGRFIRLKGDRRVVVEIPGIAAVATQFIHPSLIEILT